MTNVLEAKSVSKIYQTGTSKIYAVDNVSTTVKAGEFVALIGPSGSGKTTLLAMLAGLLRPSQGEVIVNNQNLSEMKESELTAFRLKNVGFTFQANNLVSYLTVLENVELMLRLNRTLNKQSKARAKALLARLGLEDRLNHLPAHLSGGQQQRVAIARALVHNPSIVLADEPTASLDTERAYQVVETFANLIHEQNRVGIMVTHDPRMSAYADKVMQMVDGRMVSIASNRAEIEIETNMGLPITKPSKNPQIPTRQVALTPICSDFTNSL